MTSVSLVVEPSKIILQIENTIPQKEDIILLYTGYHSIPKKTLLMCITRALVSTRSLCVWLACVTTVVANSASIFLEFRAKYLCGAHGLSFASCHVLSNCSCLTRTAILRSSTQAIRLQPQGPMRDGGLPKLGVRMITYCDSLWGPLISGTFRMGVL